MFRTKKVPLNKKYTENIMSLKDIFQEKIVLKAIKDEKFRKELKKNPKTVIERELGHIFPENMNFNIIEPDEKTFNIIIPKISNTEKLSEEELKKMAGGVFSEVYQGFC